MKYFLLILISTIDLRELKKTVDPALGSQKVSSVSRTYRLSSDRRIVHLGLSVRDT